MSFVYQRMVQKSLHKEFDEDAYLSVVGPVQVYAVLFELLPGYSIDEVALLSSILGNAETILAQATCVQQA